MFIMCLIVLYSFYIPNSTAQSLTAEQASIPLLSNVINVTQIFSKVPNYNHNLCEQALQLPREKSKQIHTVYWAQEEEPDQQVELETLHCNQFSDPKHGWYFTRNLQFSED